MRQARSIYESSRMAAHYAHDRPPIHPGIIRAVRERLGIATRVGRALDIGCGAGQSTAALEPLAETVIGIEPASAMLAHSDVVAPNASFLVGQAEQLPFLSGMFDLITAAGSVNYANLDLFLPEVARVLAPGGTLVIYDFSAGRRVRGSPSLEQWYAFFETRYPPPAGYALDVRDLAYGASGLRLVAHEEREIAVFMNLTTYLSYTLGETNVESAILRGVPEMEIRDWCSSTLAEVFGHEPREVMFDAYAAYVTRGC